MIKMTRAIALAAVLLCASTANAGSVAPITAAQKWDQLTKSAWFDHYFSLSVKVKSKEDLIARGFGTNPVFPDGTNKAEFIAAKNGDVKMQQKLYEGLALIYRGFEFDAQRTGGVKLNAVVELIWTAVFQPERFEEVVIEANDRFGGMIYYHRKSTTVVSARFVESLVEAAALKLSVVVDGTPFDLYIIEPCGNACWKYGTLNIPPTKDGPTKKVSPVPPTTSGPQQGKGARGMHVEALTQQNFFNMPEVRGDKIVTGKIRHYRSLYGVRLTKNWMFLDESPHVVVLGVSGTVATENFNFPSELTGVVNSSNALYGQLMVRGQIDDLSGTVSWTFADGPEREGTSLGAGLHYNPYRFEAEVAWQDTSTVEPNVDSEYEALVARFGLKPFELFGGLAYLRELWDFNPAIGVAWSKEELRQDWIEGHATRAEIQTEPVRGYMRFFKDLYRDDRVDPETGKTIIRWALYAFTDVQYGNKNIKLYRTDPGMDEILIGDIVTPQFDWAFEVGARVNISEIRRWMRIKRRE